MQIAAGNAVLVAVLLLSASFTSAAEVAKAPRPALLFPIPVGQASVTIPLERGRDSLYTRAAVNGEDAGYFLIDTGSTWTTISEKLAEKHRLRRIGQRASLRVHGVDHGDMALVPRLQVGPVELRDHPTTVDKNLGYEMSGGGELVGVLGMDVIGRGPFCLDFKSATLTIYDPAKFVAPDAAKAFPLLNWHGTPLVEAEVEGAKGWFQIDTGFPSQLLLLRNFISNNPHLAEGHPRLSDVGRWDDTVAEPQTKWAPVSILGRSLPNVYGGYQTGSGVVSRSAGLAGVGFFRNARLWVDVPGGTVWVEWPGDEPLDDVMERLERLPPKDLLGMTPLHQACSWGRADAVKVFLERGEDPNAADPFGVTPLMLAVGRQLPDAIEALVKHGAKLDAHTQASMGGYPALVYAATYGRSKSITVLLDANAGIDIASEGGRTALFAAADADHPEIVKLLIERGADVNRTLPTGETPLLAACRNGSQKCVSLLLANKADPNVRGRIGSALTYAAGSGSADCVRLLLQHKAIVNLTANEGVTPLMAAARAEKGFESVKLLVEAGADPKALSSEGKTALQYAVETGSIDSVRLLSSYEK